MERPSNVNSDVIVGCIEGMRVFARGGGEGEGSVREKRDERDERRYNETREGGLVSNFLQQFRSDGV